MKQIIQLTNEKEIPEFRKFQNIRHSKQELLRKVLVLLMVLITGLSFGQLTQTENYIDRKDCLNNDCTNYSETVNYFDGLGRPRQVVGVKASPSGKDIVSHNEYDAFGRPVKDYLPVPQGSTQNGGIYTNPLSSSSATYGTEKIYSEKILENSPLGRVQKQIQRGNDWSTKPVNFNYAVNSLADKIRMFTTTTVWENGATKSKLNESGFYPASQLYKNTITDEDGNTAIEFKNAKGQVALSRKVTGGTENADTYYVYNEYDQLAFVLPPLAGTAIDIGSNIVKQDQLLYQYRYDKKYRVVEKKMPGKGWEYMVYDKGGRLILSQDALLGSTTNNFGKKGWMFTKYDQLGRVAYVGFFANTSTRAVMQNAINSMVANPGNNELRTSTPFNLNGLDIYYTKAAFPTGSMTVLGVTYYDSYPIDTPPVPTQVFGQNVLQQPGTGSFIPGSTRGLPLASYVKNLDDDRWTKNYSYYSTKGREVSTISVNYLGGYTKTETEFDFTGIPLKTYTFHKRKSDETGVMVKERFVYDTQNRLKQHYHQVDDNAEVLLSDNTYNELSQLTNKKLGNNLQSIDYTYNIRGWLTGINKDQMELSDMGGKLFSCKVKYTQKEGVTNPDGVLFPGKNVIPKYNGNIAEIDWRAVEIPGIYPSLTPKRYGYAYDSLNRLTAGFYQNPMNPYSKENTESMSYDLNGNITELYRTSVMENGSSTATKIDDLAYTYNGNIAIKIKDNSNNSTGYEGTAGFPIEYDTNGNITTMLDKQITGISYNHLNLPTTVKIGFDQITSQIKTNYGADGVKLRKENVKMAIGFAGTDTTIQITDYLDGFQYFKSTSTSSSGGGSSESLLSRAFEPQAFIPIEIVELGPIFGGGTLGPISVITEKTPDLQFFPTSEGFYDYINSRYIYSYTDHLGNVRISFTKDSAGALEIVDSNDYYPYGMNHLKTGIAYFGQNTYKKYKFLGNELQETGMYDMNARFYMPDLGRFGQHDPLSESSFDPYGYSFGNPVYFKDPTGLIGMSIGFGEQGGASPTDWVYNFLTNSVYWNSSATSQSTAGENETYLGKSGTFTAYDGTTTALFDNNKAQNNSLLGPLGVLPNLDPLIKAGQNGPLMSVAAFGTPGDGSYIRATPDNPFANPSSQLAYNGLVAMQMAASGIAAEFVAAETGLTFLSSFGGQGISLSRNGIGGSYSLITEAEITVGPALFGKKFGKHGVEDFGLTNDAAGRSMYLDGIENTFLNGTVKQIPAGSKVHSGETHFLHNGNLLRVNQGQFRSYYPLDPAKL